MNKAKLPEIDSKLEFIKKNPSNNSIINSGLYSSRVYNNNNQDFSNSSRLGGGSSSYNNGNMLLSGISKKITPTKLINNGSSSGSSNNFANSSSLAGKKLLMGNPSTSVNKLNNYSSINSKRDGVSPMHYYTQREKKWNYKKEWVKNI